MRQKNMVICPAGPETKNYFWQRPAAIYPAPKPDCSPPFNSDIKNAYIFIAFSLIKHRDIFNFTSKCKGIKLKHGVLYFP
jgi:hypothetical protein